MGWQVIRQPDGLYAIFSSNTDTWIVYDATADDIVAEFVNAGRRDMRRHARKILAAINAGERAYHQFTMSFDEANLKSAGHGGDFMDADGNWEGET